MGKFKDFFEESEEEIMDEIVEEGNNINEANKKLKEIKEGKKGFFSESEDELKESIKESEESIKELKDRIIEIKRKKGERGKKKGRLSKKKRKEIIRKTSKFLFTLAVIVVVFVLVYNGAMWGIEKYKNRPFRYVCRAENPCTDCKVAVSCIQFEEIEEGKDFMYFTVRNKNDIGGKCYVNIIVEKDELALVNKTYSMGAIPKGEKAVRKIAMLLPSKNANVILNPYCEWEK